MQGDDTLKTGVDLLIDLVRKQKSISLDEASKKLNIPAPTLEMWAQFLEEEGELGIDYKLTTPYLTDKKTDRRSNKEAKYDFSGTSVENSLNIVVDLVPQAKEKLGKGKLKDAHQDFSKMVQNLKGLSLNTSGWFEKNKPEEGKKIKEEIDKITSGISQAGTLARSGEISKAKEEYLDQSKEIQALQERLSQLYSQMKGDVEKEIIQGIETGNIKTRSLSQPPPPRKPTKVNIIHTNGKNAEIDKLFDGESKTYVVEDLQAKKGVDYSKAKLVRAVHKPSSNVGESESLFSGSKEKDQPRKAKAHEAEEKYKPKTEQERLDELASETEAEGESYLNHHKSKTQTPQHESMAQRALEFAKQGKIDEAKVVLNSLYKTYMKLPAAFIKKKNELKLSILKITSELNNKQIQKSQSKEAEAIRNAREKISNIKKLVSMKDPAKALKEFEKLKEDYSKIPAKFGEDKTQLLEDLHGVHKSVLSLQKEESEKNFEEIKERFQKAYTRLQESISQRQIAQAKDLYTEISKTYAQMPKGFAEFRLVMQEKILGAYKELILEEQRMLLEKHNKNKNQIKSLVAKVRADISAGETSLVQDDFKKIQSLFENISDAFVNEKGTIQDEILAVELQISRIKIKESKEKIKASKKEVRDLFDRAKNFIKKEQYELANELFSSMTNTLHESPGGFVEQNTKLVDEIYSIYKDVYKKLNQDFLEEADDNTRIMYENMLEKLVHISDILQSGDLKKVPAVYHRLVESYTKLPVGFLLKNIKIKQEVLKVHDVYKSYKKLSELQESYSKEGAQAIAGKLVEFKAWLDKLLERYRDDSSYFNSIVSEFSDLEKEVSEVADPETASNKGLDLSNLEEESKDRLPPLPMPPPPGSKQNTEKEDSYYSEDVKKSFKPIAPIHDLELDNATNNSEKA